MLSDFLSGIDSSTMILGTFFILIFAILMFALKRTFFKDSYGIAVIIALCISLLATWGINKKNLLDLNGLFNKTGIPENTLYIITPILLLVVIIFASIKKDKETQRKNFSFSRFITILGLLMIALGISPLIYQKQFYIVVGASLLVLALIISRRNKKKEKLKNMNYFERRDYDNKQKANLKKWNNAGRKIGYGMAATGYGIGRGAGWAGRQIGRGIGRGAGYMSGRVADMKRQDAIYKQRMQENKNRKEQQIRQQREYEEELKRKQQREIAMQMQQQKQNQLALSAHEEKQQKQYIKNEKLRQKSIENLKILYNEKYQEAIKQQNFMAKGIPGAKEKYLRLQQELERIVNKINKISS